MEKENFKLVLKQ